MNPAIQTSTVETRHGVVTVVRDDMLAGGTKQRAAIPFLKQLGADEFVYASPSSGYAQIALTISCNAVKAKSVIFAESVSGGMSSFTKSINDKAMIKLCNSLELAEHAASDYASSRPSAFKIPLGFDDQRYKSLLKEAIQEQWHNLCAKTDVRRLWLPVGSGTLLSTFYQIVDVPIVCVDVGVLPENDKRIQAIHGMGNVQYMRAPELFAEKVKSAPPIPSNEFYDAKLWQFIVENGKSGDVWWNVAA